MAKRKQVKNACVNCQRACKKCDDARPCTRCVKYGIEHTCINSSRKERRRLKRKLARESSPRSGANKNSDDVWNSSTERPKRSKKAINYFERKDESDNDDESSEEDEIPEIPTKNILPEVPGIHQPLLNLVRNVSRNREVYENYPKIRELAAVCSEMLRMEFNVQLEQIPRSVSPLSSSLSNASETVDRNTTENYFAPPLPVPSPPVTPIPIKIRVPTEAFRNYS